MSLQIQRSHRSYTLDAATMLKDAGAVTSTAAAQVGGQARVLDFGRITSGPAVEQVAYTEFDLVIDVAAMDRGDADESYDLVLQLSDNASGNGGGFQAGDTVVPKVVIRLGEELGPQGDPDAAITTSKRIVVRVDNERLGTVFRFARMAHVIAGMSPSINYTAFLSKC